MRMKRIINKWLVQISGYQLVRLGGSGGYIDARATVDAAKAEGLSVCEYVEKLWGQEGATERVIREMEKAGSLTPCDRVCEIGPGTGRYLERILQRVSPKQYEIYEIADDWATWLQATYAPIVVRQLADGHTLRHTASESCGLVHAHGVFVYLPFLNAFEYFGEMARVCAAGGYVVFDFYSDEHFGPDVIRRWLNSTERYPVILPRKTVLQYFGEYGCSPVYEFENKHGHSYSHYVVLRKTG